MRQIKIIVVSICFLLLMGEPAFAGSLNANEQELVGIITGTYTYKGVTYRVKDRYVQMAIDYLMQDEVDLTDEQKQKAVNKMYSSIQQGIDEGYLEAAGGGGGQPGAGGGNADGTGGAGESGTGGSGPGGTGNAGGGAAGKQGNNSGQPGGGSGQPGNGSGQPGDSSGQPGMSAEAVTVPETTVSPMVLSLEAVAAENRGLSRPAGLSGWELDSSGGTSGADRGHLGADGSYLGPSGTHPETAEGQGFGTTDAGTSGNGGLADAENELSGQAPHSTANNQPGTSGLLTLAFGTCSGLAIGTVLCILAAIRGKLFSHHDKRKKGMV